ncbi:hypothetical protein GCM10011309_12210 [Litorimonas cladophorae]|uniref:JmjC domain-containing protein n=1 Tax=Litorimonas cladophorae TaxID=1220491 RepID=A0A918KHI9_9PROT|nr:hypothetical protein [Litorimonas cladophorae]GGX63748.1 hypothetical protein GCM10011309_12210 [Litorimonas cladophorae]
MLNDNTTPYHDDQPEISGGTPMAPMIPDWSAQNSAAFQKEITSFEHNLAGTGLFTDEALIDLLERHPSEKLDVCTMGASDHPLYPNKFRTGDFRDVPGKVLLDAAKAGRVWINVREAMNIHPEYKSALDRMYGELSEKTGNRAFNPRGGILISSPVARVPYHFDKTETILWHVRGQKRMYLYPLTQKFIPDESYEASITDFLSDDLPYDASYDEAATVIDIPEGAALTWPLNQPHRVDNQTFCVSVTTEYSTRESGMKNAAMVTNATLRHRFGMSPSYATDSELSRKVKSIAGRVLRKTPLVPDTSSPDMVTFRIDANADDFIVDTDPYPRTF